VLPAPLNQLMPTRPADLLYGMPGVYVQERPDDPGTAINIRGLQDFGRVAVVVDGARQNFQRTGHNANGIFYLEPELISSIDVVRGPVANIFGSGAIGGVASFRTKDVDDVLKVGERWGVLTNNMGSSNFGGVTTAFAAARLTPAAELFAGGTYRTQNPYRDGNDNVVPNTGYNVETGTVKGTFRPAPGHQVKVGYIDYEAAYTTGQPFPPGTPAALGVDLWHQHAQRARHRALDLFAAGRPPARFRRQHLREQDVDRSDQDRRHRRSGVGFRRQSAQLHHRHHRLRCQQHHALRYRSVPACAQRRRRQLP
jgi:outer membrane receptor protein involved in Fe transport